MTNTQNISIFNIYQHEMLTGMPLLSRKNDLFGTNLCYICWQYELNIFPHKRPLKIGDFCCSLLKITGLYCKRLRDYALHGSSKKPIDVGL